MSDQTKEEYDIVEENWRRGWEEAIDYVLDISREMRESYNYHNPSLDELEQRIV